MGHVMGNLVGSSLSSIPDLGGYLAYPSVEAAVHHGWGGGPVRVYTHPLGVPMPKGAQHQIVSKTNKNHHDRARERPRKKGTALYFGPFNGTFFPGPELGGKLAGMALKLPCPPTFHES